MSALARRLPMCRDCPHSLLAHDHGNGPCMAEACNCQRYEPRGCPAGHTMAVHQDETKPGAYWCGFCGRKWGSGWPE